MDSSDIDPIYCMVPLAHMSQTSQTASRSVQPFLHSTPVWPKHTQTHRPRYMRHNECRNRPYLSMSCMRCNLGTGLTATKHCAEVLLGNGLRLEPKWRRRTARIMTLMMTMMNASWYSCCRSRRPCCRRASSWHLAWVITYFATSQIPAAHTCSSLRLADKTPLH